MARYSIRSLTLRDGIQEPAPAAPWHAPSYGRSSTGTPTCLQAINCYRPGSQNITPSLLQSNAPPMRPPQAGGFRPPMHQ